MSFKAHLLTEAFKAKSMPSIVSKAVNIISRRIGQQFYPYNKNGLQILKADGKTYSGYLFFMQSLKAVRFNTIGGQFDSIEIWNRYTLGSKSDFTIRLDGMNIVKIINDIADIIKKPSAGVFHVRESEEFDGETLEEAKQVKDPHHFHHLGIKTFGMNKDHSRLSWEDVQHIADTHDVRVPGWVRNTKKGSGRNATYSIVPDTHISGAPAGTKPDKDYFIKVSPRDNTTNKFVSVKDDEEAQRLTSLIKAAVEAPKTRELKELARDPNSLFNKMTSLITLVIKGLRPAVFIYGGPGTGKAQPLASQIKTPNGWTTMGEIKFGDEIITPKGTVTKVIGIFPQGKLDVYEITFADGRKTQCSKDHLWQVFGGNHKKKRYKQSQVLTTEELMNRAYKTNSYYVPLIEHVCMDDISLPMNPYILGTIIGDGCTCHTNATSISSSDSFIIEKITSLLSENYSLKQANGYDYYIRGTDNDINSYNSIIRELGLVNKKSFEKFIPEIYKNSSLKQKIELIQGLMDTDGEVDKNGSVYFHTTSERLKDDFVDLIRSIGGLAYVRERIPSYTYKDEKKTGRRAYSIRIRYRNIRDLVSLPRKKDRVSDNPQYSDYQLRITNIEKLPTQEEMQCISVLDKNQLYITDDYITTHNTFVSLECLKNNGLHKNKDYFYQSGGKVSPAELYRLLFMHRSANEILVFDDMDSVFDNDISSNILKAALDSKPEREISWSSNRTVNVSKWSDETREAYEKKIDAFLRGEDEEEFEDELDDDEDKEDKKKKEKQPERLPSKFTYRGKVVFISNLPASKVDKAVMNRAYQIDMTLTEEEMIARIRHLFPHILPNISQEIKEEALAAVIKARHMNEIDYISIRTFEEAAKVANSGLPNWRDLIPHV